MQRKPTKNTRGPNADEKRFQGWLKDGGWCVACDEYHPVVVHHCEGATFKHNKVLVGHWFCLPLCAGCDDVVTTGSRRAFREKFGSQSDLWLSVINDYLCETGCGVPSDVRYAIEDWNK